MQSKSKLANAIRNVHLMGYRAIDGNRVVKKCVDIPVWVTTRSGGRTPYSYFKDEQRINIPVHRLVAFQKFGEAALVKGVHTRHKDNNSLNNDAVNILVGTAHDNRMDLPELMRRKSASNASQKLDYATIASIRAERLAGKKFANLSRKYGVSGSTISYYCSPKAKRMSFSFPPI